MILSPAQDMTYFLVSEKQKLVLHATSSIDVNEHVWYLDDTYLGREKVGEKVFVSLRQGEHRITCVDDRGRMATVKINIKYMM